jgi:hypothetical protein
MNTTKIKSLDERKKDMVSYLKFVQEAFKKNSEFIESINKVINLYEIDELFIERIGKSGEALSDELNGVIQFMEDVASELNRLAPPEIQRDLKINKIIS